MIYNISGVYTVRLWSYNQDAYPIMTVYFHSGHCRSNFQPITNGNASSRSTGVEPCKPRYSLFKKFWMPKMEFDILDSLDDLGYSGTLKSDEEFSEAIEKGPKSLAFTQLVEWLSKELQALYSLESCVHSLTDISDASSFLLEVSSFLKELHCPYKFLLNGPISQRLLDVQSKRTLLDFLCTELQTARLLQSKKEVKHDLEIEVEESSTALCLQNTLDVLNIDTDFSSCPHSCIAEIENKVFSLLQSKPDSLPEPLLKDELTEEQWVSMTAMYEEFFYDYKIRREMLLTRLDVTIQSFLWGEGSKSKEKKILEIHVPRRKRLKTKPIVMLHDIIAARENLLILEKTSSAELVKNTKSSVKQVLIANVPDRGGRPKEQRPPVEMPNWMKRAPGGGQGDHSRGGHWQGRGGKKFRGSQDGRGKGKKSFDAAGKY